MNISKIKEAIENNQVIIKSTKGTFIVPEETDPLDLIDCNTIAVYGDGFTKTDILCEY